MKRVNRQAMARNLRGKKVQTRQDDEIRYVFTTTKKNYSKNLKHILFCTSYGEEKRAWANRVGLVGVFEVEWQIPCHNILVEFLNN
jgi:hypothetical protein